MKSKTCWPETTVVFGAGAEASIGLPTTQDIGDCLSRLAGVGPDVTVSSSLEDRIAAAFKGRAIAQEQKDELKLLLTLLFDGDGATDDAISIQKTNKATENFIKRHLVKFKLSPADADTIRYSIEGLRKSYDWLGVRGILQHMGRQWDEDKESQGCVPLIDILTVVDQLLNSNLGMETAELFQSPQYNNTDDTYFMDEIRLIGTKRCLKMLIITIVTMMAQPRPGNLDKNRINPHFEIYKALSRLILEESKTFFARGYPTNQRQFYLFSYAIVSFNWSPILMWLTFNANKIINDQQHKLDNSTLRLFNDPGELVGVRKILDKHETDDENLLQFMLNESICYKINDKKYSQHANSRLYRVGKMCFPHGGLGWRQCPRCGKLFTDLAKDWSNLYTTAPFGPGLLPSLNAAWEPRTNREKERRRNEARFSTIECVYCGHLTEISDVPVFLQSGIKTNRPLALEGQLREMALLLGNARHLVFIGYSLPDDDYIYRVLIKAARSSASQNGSKEWCTLVLRDDTTSKLAKSWGSKWLNGSKITSKLSQCKLDQKLSETIKRYFSVFTPDHCRLNFDGWPNVISDYGMDEASLKRAWIDFLYPKEAIREGFPVKRHI